MLAVDVTLQLFRGKTLAYVAGAFCYTINEEAEWCLKLCYTSSTLALITLATAENIDNKSTNWRFIQTVKYSEPFDLKAKQCNKNFLRV